MAPINIMRRQKMSEGNIRGEISSICRETAKSFDMSRNGSRWRCEVTDISISGQGIKSIRFYIHDKNSGREYQAQAVIENNETAEWKILEVID